MSETRSWLAAEVPGLELLGGAFHRHAFPRHCHDGLMLAVIRSGAQRFFHRGSSHVATPGQVVAMPPGEVHASEAATGEGWSFQVLTVPPTVIEAVADARCSDGFRSSIVIDNAALASQLQGCYAAFAGPADRLERETRLRLAVHRYFTDHVRPGPAPISVGSEPQAVRRAMAYLSSHRQRAVGLDELASVCGLDGFRLTRAFTREVGMPPHAYHLQARVHAARAPLAAGLAISEVALQAGFADQAHFTRMFKRYTAVTPGQFRAAHGHASR